MKRFVIFPTIALLAVIAGCGGGGGAKSVFDDRSCINSPDGDVLFGSMAWNPAEANVYAAEVQQVNKGKIGIFRGNALELEIDVLSGYSNSLKGLAWSRSGKYIAVNYHGGVRSGINIYNAKTGEWAQKVYADNAHFMVFGPTDATIYISWLGDDEQEVPTGL